MKQLMKKLVTLLILVFVLTITTSYILPNSQYIKEVEAATVKLNKSKIVIKVGETYQLKLKGTKEKVKWSSNKKSIATVSPNGLVTGIKSGNMNITAKVGKKTYICVVTVMYPTLNKSNFKAGIGDTLQLNIKNLPMNIDKDSIKFKSDNNKVAIVSDTGLITTLSEGYANIKITFGSYKLYCSVIAEFTDKNKEDAINNLEVEYIEMDNQIVCILKNSSNIDLLLGYDLAFYDSADKLVSLSGIPGAAEIIFAGDEKVLFIEKTDKEFSSYKIRFNKVISYGYEENLRDKVDVQASELYDYEFYYREWIANYPINYSDTVQLFDLNVNNRSEQRVMVEAYVIYYNGSDIVDVEVFERYGNMDIGFSVIKNPKTKWYNNAKIVVPDYNSYRIIYTVRAIR